MILVWVLASALALALAAAGWIARGFWDHAGDEPPASTLIADDITEELAAIHHEATDADAFVRELHTIAPEVWADRNAGRFDSALPGEGGQPVAGSLPGYPGWLPEWRPVPDDTDRLASTGEMWMFRQTLALEDFRHEFLSAEWAGRVLAEAWR